MVASKGHGAPIGAVCEVGWPHGEASWRGGAADLDGVIGTGDERDEEAQHHVDEEADEGVKVDLGEEPDEAAAALLRLHRRKRHKHVIPIDE